MKSSDRSAIVGHHDRTGLKDTRHYEFLELLAWLARLQPGRPEGTGGAGLIYCFLAELNAPRAWPHFAHLGRRGTRHPSWGHPATV